MGKLKTGPRSLRPEFNGDPSVKRGIIAAKGITSWDKAVVMKNALRDDYPDFDFEIGGVDGDYRIIQRDREATPLT